MQVNTMFLEMDALFSFVVLSVNHIMLNVHNVNQWRTQRVINGGNLPVC